MLETYFGFLRRRGQADLSRGGKVFEYFAPGGILGGAAAMTLIDDDQIEEPGRELTEQLLPFLRPGDRLIEAEIDLVRRVDATLLVEGKRQIDLRCRRRRSIVFALVLSFAIAAPNGRKSFTIVWSMSMLRSARKRMRFFLPGLPQTPDDLEGGVGFAGSGRHDQQHAVLPLAIASIAALMALTW